MMNDTVYEKEPLLCRILLVCMIFEVPYLKLYLVAALFMALCYVFLYGRRPVVNGSMLLILLFGVLYFVFDTYLAQTSTYKVWYVISMVCIYACGYYIPFERMNLQVRSKKMREGIAFIAKTYCVFVFITMLYSWASGQLFLSRNPLNIWTGELRAATHFGTMLIIPVAYGLYLLLLENSKKERWIGACILLLSVITSVMTASRTVLYIIPIGLVIAYIYAVRIEGGFTTKHLNWIFGFTLLIAIALLAYTLNFAGISDALANTALGQRYLAGEAGSLVDDGRFAHMAYFFANIKKCLWGGAYARTNAGNLHNVYLNVIDLSGIIPFALLVAITIIAIKDIRNVGKYGLVDNKTVALIKLFYILVFIQFMLEPVMESVPVMFWCVLMITGMLRNLCAYEYEDLSE